MAKTTDLTGRVFGRLAVIGRHPQSGRSGDARWMCECECGQTTTVNASALRSGGTRSCGCLKQELTTTHGHCRGREMSPEYQSWHSMGQRCLNPNHHAYADYGGRGIDIDPRWVESFEVFLAEMGPRLEGTSLDRIDNDAGYWASNCRWATVAEQMRNRRPPTRRLTCCRGHVYDRVLVGRSICYACQRQRSVAYRRRRSDDIARHGA